MLLDAGSLIRAGSGLLLALLGVGVLAVGRRRIGAAWLGLLLLAFGGELILANLQLGGP